jgi:hypothetical protein
MKICLINKTVLLFFRTAATAAVLFCLGNAYISPIILMWQIFGGDEATMSPTHFE